MHCRSLRLFFFSHKTLGEPIHFRQHLHPLIQVMSAAPQVTISDCGTVRGIQANTQSTVIKFLNIPYATVTERWRPAVKAAPWTGVRDASVQG